MSVNRLNHVQDKYQGRVDYYAMDLVYVAKQLLIDLKYHPRIHYRKEVVEDLNNLCDKLRDVLFFKEEK